MNADHADFLEPGRGSTRIPRIFEFVSSAEVETTNRAADQRGSTRIFDFAWSAEGRNDAADSWAREGNSLASRKDPESALIRGAVFP
jgi:hypothetical protein